MNVRFNVIGVPAPQGSKTRMPNGAMVEGSSATGRAKHRTWRQAVAQEAHHQRQLLEHCFTGPLFVAVVFRFPMPASRPAAFKRRVASGEITGWKTSKPDLDKLARSIGDSLTEAGLIERDELISQWTATKIEVPAGEWTGATITIAELP
jgi:Holliday junction resolvase RusA-like endonuclease